MKHDNVQREFELSMLVVKRSMSSGLLDSGCYVYIRKPRSKKVTKTSILKSGNRCPLLSRFPLAG